MLPEKGKKILYFFLTIYIIFAVVIVYLFLFNSGLEIVEEFNEEEFRKDVYVFNNTQRIIHNVSVKHKIGNQEIDLNSFRFLLPQEKKLIPLDDLRSNQVTLLVGAPFHVTIEQLIVLRAAGETLLKTSFPSTILFGQAFNFTMEVCNNSGREDQFKIEEKHDPSVFSEPTRTDTLTIEDRNCAKVEYSLLPIQKGETTIYFNVDSSNTTDKVEQEITVE